MIGDDDFLLKTSVDGSVWINSFRASKTDASVDFLAGIKFSGGTKLSTYAEGTWTPTLRGATTAGTNTYTTQAGRYIKIGKHVHISGRITISGAVDATMSGNMQIAGLPFTVANSTGADGIMAVGEMSNANLTASTQINGIAQPNTTVISLGERSNTGVSNLTATTKFNSNFAIRFSMHYEATS